MTSIAGALARSGGVDAEIVVVDNGSTDGTSEAMRAWASSNAIPSQLLYEAKKGISAAHNRALRYARGDILCFTDDDCRLHTDYVKDLLRHDLKDSSLVVRGGRIELGDETDLPLTINTDQTVTRWSLSERSARAKRLCGRINGCNMVMRRKVIELIGGFDEQFGAGSYVGSGGDSDFLFRSYIAGIIIEYVPDMVVFHYHGRKTYEEGRNLMRRYTMANGALWTRYFFKHPDLCQIFYHDFREAAVGLFTGKNQWAGFSHKQRIFYTLFGVVKYVLRPRQCLSWLSA